jgi:putative transposase
MLGRADANRSLLVVETQKGPSMRFADSIFASLLKPIDRRQFARIVDEHDGDAYDKSFRSWDHLVALVYAQFGKVESLRALEAGFNANSQHHYHLGTGKLARSTLADANGRRPIAIFAQTFAMLAGAADRRTRQEGAVMVRLIDASPVPLHKACSWAPCNGRIRGMKLHVVYDPLADVPTAVAVTSATVNDIEIGRQTAIAAGATYVFDKGYCRFDWWQKINDRGLSLSLGRSGACGCAPSSIGPCINPMGTASRSWPMTKSGWSARATPGWRCRCGGSRSAARRAA